MTHRCVSVLVSNPILLSQLKTFEPITYSGVSQPFLDAGALISRETHTSENVYRP